MEGVRVGWRPRLRFLRFLRERWHRPPGGWAATIDIELRSTGPEGGGCPPMSMSRTKPGFPPLQITQGWAPSFVEKLKWASPLSAVGGHGFESGS
jgi:hypothetical protein